MSQPKHIHALANKALERAAASLGDSSGAAQNGHFSRLPAAAVYDRRLTDRDVRVLAALGVYADRSSRCWPAVGTIASHLGVSRQAIQRQLRRLQVFGYVVVIHQQRKTGGHGPNLYQLLYPASQNGLGGPREGGNRSQRAFAYPESNRR